MDFKSDLIDIVKQYSTTEGIAFEDTGDTSDFAARYFEMRIRRIEPYPRYVHFSCELHRSLGDLARETNGDRRDGALEAWRTVFYLRHLFDSGGRVTPHLSKGVSDSTSKDGTLWDFGMHHFHLSRKLHKSGFVERSDYLLFVIVTAQDAYFVDVRKHRDPDDLLWVRQDLLDIVHANWPQLTNSYVLHGVSGTVLTDEEKRELRRKNINHIQSIEGQAIAPLGWGTNLAGGSTLCRFWGDKLVHEIEQHESIINSHHAELRTRFMAKGIDVSEDMKFQLVPLENFDQKDDLIEELQKHDCLSRELSQMGYVVVEAKTRLPIVVTVIDES